MAFDSEIQALAGSATQSEMDQWMTDGAKEIINLLPPKLKEKCTTISIINADNGTTLDLDGIGDVLQITRKSASDGYYVPCRKVHAMHGDLTNDSSSIYYASVTDPAYWITSNSSDSATLFVKPTATNTQPANAYHVTYPAIDASAASAIANFPDEAEYLVVLYAAIKVLQNKMNEMDTNSDITTAFTAVNTELDETQAICDLINTQVDSAVSELGEAATQVDAGVDTALAGIATAAGRVNTAVALANGQFDAGVLEAAQAEGEADDGAIATALAAINTNIDSAVTDIALAKTEAAEIATQTDNSSDIATALTAINTELDKVDEICSEANTEFDKVDNVIVEGSVEFDKSDAILDLGEADSESAVNTAAAKIITEMGETHGVCDLINTQVDSAVTELAKAVTEAGEMIAQTDNSGDFETALDAINTAVDHFRGTSDPALFGDEEQYTSGVGLTHVKDPVDNARTIIDDGANSPTGNSAGDAATYLYTEEDTELLNGALGIAQTEISRAQAHISEWSAAVQALQAEINGFATEVQSRASFTGAKGQAVQAIVSEASGYLNAASGYASEIQSKLSIAQGYATEANVRMQRDNQKYQWYQGQQAKLQQDYNQGLQLSGITQPQQQGAR